MKAALVEWTGCPAVWKISEVPKPRERLFEHQPADEVSIVFDSRRASTARPPSP